jgi:Fe-S-cluster-containing dehydrogenase component/anaerobic selenocysteine-containing dehydrogenase
MTKNRTEIGFAHNPDAIPGVETRIRRNEDGNVTVSFGDGSETLNISRRDFMRIGGVAAATAAMAGSGCDAFRNDVDYIVPYVDRPEEIRIGTPNYYASVCSGCSAGCGVLVTSRGGRPVKLEGNPQHPVNLGGLCSRGQASYMNLYDPDRSRTPVKVAESGAHTPISWDEIDRLVTGLVDQSKSGGGIALLTKTFTGSARKGLLADMTSALPGLKHYTYEALNSEALLVASEVCFGSRHIPQYKFDKAQQIVSLGSDFLGTWLSPVEFTKQFSSRRNPDGEMSRMVAFESTLSLTGMNADERFMVRPNDLVYVGLALAHTVVVSKKTGPFANSPLATSLAPFTPAAVASALGLDAAKLTKAGEDLANHPGASLVVAGGLASATETGLALEIVVNILNASLGNEGVSVDRSRVSNQEAGGLAELTALIKDIKAGKVDVLIIDRANPIYSAPPSLGFEEALKSVKFVLSTTDRVDETSIHADYLAPAGHALEQWGDSNPIDGVFAIQQPGITPLHSTRGFEESLMTWFGNAVGTQFAGYLAPQAPTPGNHGTGVPLDPGPWYRYLRAHWEKTVHPKADGLTSFEQFWTDTLRKGVFVQAKTRLAQPRFNGPSAIASIPKSLAAAPKSATGGLENKELQFFASATLFDGENANNGHLQETPDVITKHVWGSYAMVGPKSFKALNLTQGQYLQVKVGSVERTFPIIMQPGHHEDVISIPLGYGRTHVGIVGDEVGNNGFLFSGVSADGRHVLGGVKAELKALRESEKIAIVQGSQVLDVARRPILSTTTLNEYKADEASGIHAHPDLADMWAAHKYTVKWGMAIDLSKCTGCSACVTACQEENNIPVVGRHGILEGREMHWMRIDRYYLLPEEAAHSQENPIHDPMLNAEPVVAFSEFMENPRVVFQPMLCQHCENAPCETVCPVSATMHSADGLNQMVYNRCVGTRYCSNNCPFKVRRYNWFNYSADRSDALVARLYPELKEHSRLNVSEPLPMGFNPEVTVRSRGVMEKCTFCVQRIRRANWQIREEGRSTFRDGDVVPACQQSCPADAIEFGNLMDENSRVAKLHAKSRALTPLGEINVQSSIAYLTNVWNTTITNWNTGHHGGPEAVGHGESNETHGEGAH